MSKRKREPKMFGWTQKGLLLLPAQRGDRGLSVMVDVEMFSVIALEIPRLPTTGSVDEVATKIFDAHAHKYVGTATTLHAAIAMAESYARDWLTADEPAPELCNCGEVAAHG